MRLLIGYDGSPGAKAALDDLRWMGLSAGSDLLLVLVTEVWIAPLAGLESTEIGGVAERAEDSRHHLTRAVERLRADQTELMIDQVETLIESGSPASTILHRAIEWGADMIIVGSHSASPLERVFMGSVSQRVAAEAQCSVRIARGRLEETCSVPRRLVIGIDGSIDSEQALSVVANRHWPEGTEVRLVTSIGPFSQELNPRKIDEERHTISEVHAKAMQRLSQHSGGIMTTTSVISIKDPKHALLQEAESWGADTIFVGSRGRGRLGRFLLGSVSSAVASRAHCSVEIVRKATTVGDEESAEERQ
ncbi:MAG: universal stress protein [Acidobacteria bacterium]|nr:universal stress protein [Acidobacteriota bacterium]